MNRLKIIVSIWYMAFAFLAVSIHPVWGQNENWDDRFESLGLNGSVQAIAIDGGDIYVGGSFTMAGAVSANYIAKWDGSAWSTLGTGVNNGTNGNVLAIATDGNNVYVGGSFTSAGGVSANSIAKWDGASWSALGEGISGGDIRAIAVGMNEIYVGGFFTTAGAITANYIACWDGANWTSLGSDGSNGVNATVLAIATKEDTVFVGGNFNKAGGIDANKIAMWDKSTGNWATLGSGVGLGDVNALVIKDNDLFAGGNFTSAGGANAKKIAKWNGSAWSALSGGEISGGDVHAMAWLGNDLYVTGTFSTVGGMSASEIAKWDGSSWSILGSGLEGGPAFAIATTVADEVYVGGSFTTAGGKSSQNFARWDAGSAVPVELTSFTATPREKEVVLQWLTASEFNNYGFEVERMLNHESASTAGRWEKIAFLKGHGTSNESHTYSYVDDLQALIFVGSLSLKYRLKQIDFDGTFKYHNEVAVTLGQRPDKIVLVQNYPNPFNPETTIAFTVPEDGNAILRIHNILGQEVRTMAKNDLKAGVTYTLKLDASSLPSGTYYYSLQSGSFIETKRMVLVR